jgi:cobalt/nickel transport system permease protein
VAATTWLEKTVADVAGSIERAVFTEEHARKRGWLQSLDPRAKLVMFLALVLAAGLSASLPVLVALYAAILVAGRASSTPFDFFVKRVWLGIPLFAGIVIVPSLFLGPAPYLVRERLGPLTLAVSIPAIWGALVFVARVGVSVSLAVLLVLTTPWADLLKSLQTLRVPQVFILVLSMTYRYIFLFLHTLNGLLESRKSRIVGRTTGTEQRRWIVSSMGYLMNRSFQMSGDVYSAMLARGFGGRVRSYTAYRMAVADWCAVAGALVLAAAAVAAPHVVTG